MRKLILLITLSAPVVLLTGCSKMQSPKNIGQVEASVEAPADPQQAAQPGKPKPVERAASVIPSGTPLQVRVDESINTRSNHAGDGFTATLSAPVEVDGRTLVPAGTQFAGHVTTAAASGRMKGRARIGLTLDS